ncbi:YsnF/AvaK domain-containing protein [Pontibacter sp. KCTC 32443]|uniref:YsnF/AvaK domain-containing protein n=1 Tax=Pontibacter TaxID=323449 RepID=UPI00164CFC29|nr:MULTISPECIES: YsnF/AvaK domain-containing protein [Pontibacter]MBC5774852.1 YsnF/AvaK domain-containing protein [Pontibacter sp. KCTC 32443]
MSKQSKKVQLSEFEEKLQESRLQAERAGTQPGAPKEPFRIERDDVADREEKVIPVIEEQVHVEKRTVESGKVRISKNVREDEVMVDIPVVHEEVDVQRIPVDQYVEQAPPAVRYEGDKMIISVLREELVLVKRIKVVEELHITNRRVEDHKTQPINLRREEINIERLRNDDLNTP